jgi:hypothetical protein
VLFFAENEYFSFLKGLYSKVGKLDKILVEYFFVPKMGGIREKNLTNIFATGLYK